ncbi:AAA family ATPase [Pseudomonas sp. MWU13-2105]|uniref:AAA family ATPase n=1 Tax=Pseudomonas sp. MWU13-2105 TaxID=2935074 RepID=UPI00200EAF51|nr:AAA family ATPase [Pseudomonas sp. MWU13-2105]
MDNKEKIQLAWTEKGQDVPLNSSALSDGTLRFICLATVLLQPETFMPSAILIDEPELGLPPFAIITLGALMRARAQKHQLIISTQSVELVNEFDVHDLIVVDKVDGASVFKRLDESLLAEWLEEYSLGDLWKKNLLGGQSRHLLEMPCLREEPS